MADGATSLNQGRFPTIAFVNLATVPLGVDLDKLVAALDTQMQRDFVPIWGYPAKLYVTQTPQPGEWQVVFMDDADKAGALGYHNITKDGQPASKVFVKTTLAAGDKVSVTTSHELLEMMIDPCAQLWAQNSDGQFHAYEMCDAVEDEVYQINGITVSDFVYPSFFEPWHAPNSTQFDFLQKVTQPYQTLSNGYQMVSDGKTANEVFGSREKEEHFRKFEDRTMHRSEYRKATMTRAAGGPGSARSDGMSPHAAMLHHAGKFLEALAAVVDGAPGAPSEPGRGMVVPRAASDPYQT